MSQLPSMLRQAVEHHQQGRWAEAIALYDRILDQAPEHADTLYLRGLVAHQLGDARTALVLIPKAIAINPQKAVYHLHLGQALERDGQQSAARSSFEEAIRREPGLAESHACLGMLELQAGRLNEASGHLRRAIDRDQTNWTTWNNLGRVELERGDWNSAETALRQAGALNPSSREVSFNQARLHVARGENSQAIEILRAILAEAPAFPPAVIELGRLLGLDQPTARDRFEVARLYFEAALDAESASADLWFAYACLAHQAAEFTRARQAYERTLAIAPNHAAARGNLGSLLRLMGEPERAVEELVIAVRDDPSLERNRVNLANAYVETGELDRARQTFTHSQRGPVHWLDRLRSAHVCPLLYESEQEIEDYRSVLIDQLDELGSERRSLEGIDLATSGAEPSFNIPFHGGDDRPIKVKHARLFDGLIPNVNRMHARRSGSRPRVGIVVTRGNEYLFRRSMLGIVRQLDPKQLDIVLCVSEHSTIGSDWAEPARSVDVVRLPTRFDEAAALLAMSACDLLYFWEVGTDSTNYFLPFVRAAPVQCTSWGIQVTSGIPAIDDYLSCRLVEPDSAADHYSERLVLLDALPTCQPRQSVEGSPFDRSAIGLSPGDHFYLCAQNPGKFHPAFVRVLATILDQDANAALVVTGSRRPKIHARFEKILRQRLGASAARLRLLPPQSVADYLGLVASADVVLDPFPFGGVNSSYDAFSLHRPVVTLTGTYHRGRYTSGCYGAMEMAETPARAVDDYIRTAVEWGRDQAARQSVVERIAERSEVLFEDVRPARELEEYFLSRIAGVNS